MVKFPGALQYLSAIATALFFWCPKGDCADLPPDGTVNSNRPFVLEPNGGFVSLTASAPDGKLIAAGAFTSINGHTSPKIIRFHQNGQVDRSLASPLAPGGDDVRALAVQMDGRILAGGLFTQFGGRDIKFLGRLTAEGLVDPTFRFHPEPGDQIVSAVAALPDGGIVIAGGQVLNGIGTGYYRRLLADGSVDVAMKQRVTGAITSMLLQPDGKVLLGGANFRVAPNTDRFRVVRVNQDGSFDSTWNYGLVGSSGGPGVAVMALQSDGKLLIAPPGTSLGPLPLERASPDGTLDSGFHVPQVGNGLSIAALAVQPDAAILVGLSSPVQGRLIRLLPDGSLDSTFSSTASGNAGLRALGLLPDGTALLFGAFRTWADVPLGGIARLSLYATPAKIFSMSRTADAAELWEGAHQEFSVIAGGTPDPDYQWTFNGSPLNGARSETLTLNAVTPQQSGSYNVTVKNSLGSDTGTGFRLNVQSGPPQFVQDLLDDQSARIGGTANFLGLAVGGPLPSYQWFKDGVALAGQTGFTLVLSNLPPGVEKSIFTLQVQNNHGAITSPPLHIVLTADGSVHPEFALERRITAAFNPPPSACQLSTLDPWPSVYSAGAIGVQDDGRILVGGPFGQNTWVSAHLQRLMPDGSQDRTFKITGGPDSSGLDAEVDAIAVVPHTIDPCWYIGGRFTKINGLTRIGLARMDGDGSVNLEFSPALAVNGRPGGSVSAILVAPDGKLLVAGLFEKINDTGHPFIARFNADGSVDESFKGTLRFTSSTAVGALALQTDGKILLGGAGGFDPNVTGRLIRLEADGSVDQEFSAGSAFGDFASITKIAVDTYGRILATGPFFSFSSNPRSGIVRILPDGSPDASFSPVIFRSGESFSSFALQPNGRILVAGSFSSLDQHPTHGIARLNGDGSVDRAFLADARITPVNTIALLNDGVLAVGSFNLLERSAGKIGDCNASPADEGIVKLETGDINELPNDPPQIIQQPQGVTVSGGNITLTVGAVGAQPLSYTWFRDGQVLSASDQASLTIANAKPTDDADYTVRVKNKFGSILSDPATIRVVESLSPKVQPVLDASGFRFHLALSDNGQFDATDLQKVQLQVSDDLEAWQVVDAAIKVVNGEVELVDPGAVLKPRRFYRFVWGTPSPPEPTAVADDSGLVPIANVPVTAMHAAQMHLQDFIVPSSRGFNSTVGSQEWVGVDFAPQARYLFDPAYKDGNEPAYVEFKMNHTRSKTPRGYMIVSMSEEDFPILEFGTSGLTKTERVLRNSTTGTVHKFFRMAPGFFTGEDTNGNMIVSWGTSPLKLDPNATGDTGQQQGSYDSETDTAILPRATHPAVSGFATYNELKNDMKTNPLRVHLRSLRVAEAATQWVPVRGERYPVLQLKLRETNIFFPAQTFISARVDSDDDSISVSAQALREGGVGIVGLHPGSDILRLRTSTGSLLAYTVTVSSSVLGGLVSAQGECDDTSNEDWWAGTGWSGDQRRYYQLQDYNLWCPDVGCGPTALAMLLGWWDANGVPSAFYHLRSRTEGSAAINFRFDFNSLKTSDAPRDIDPYDDAGFEAVYGAYVDLNDLCNTQCYSFTDQGATFPDQMASGFVEYMTRVCKDQPYPMNEYGSRFVGCEVNAHWVTAGFGETDWEGGGTLVANGIKDGHPGVVGIGSVAWDCHYPLAYVYRRHSHYVGCGSDRHRVSLTRSFKCNMGWGPGHEPEWHNAEDVWFGLTANMWQKKLPVWLIKHVIPIPGLF